MYKTSGNESSKKSIGLDREKLVGILSSLSEINAFVAKALVNSGDGYTFWYESEFLFASELNEALKKWADSLPELHRDSL